MAQLGGHYWQQFFPPLAKTLLDAQSPDGCWLAESGEDGIYGSAYPTCALGAHADASQPAAADLPAPSGGVERAYIRSTVSMPSRFSPRWSVRAVRSQRRRRLVRSLGFRFEHGAVLEELAVPAGQVEQIAVR